MMNSRAYSTEIFVTIKVRKKWTNDGSESFSAVKVIDELVPHYKRIRIADSLTVTANGDSTAEIRQRIDDGIQYPDSVDGKIEYIAETISMDQFQEWKKILIDNGWREAEASND